MGDILQVWCAAQGAKGAGDLAEPLSAQAKMPSRPSGADKKQEPAKKGRSAQRSRNRFGTNGVSHCSVNSNHVAANQHCHTFRSASSARTVDGSLPHWTFSLCKRELRPAATAKDGQHG
jgi:hypothetical protein